MRLISANLKNLKMDSEKESKSEDEKFKEKVKDIFLQLTKEHDQIKSQLHGKTSDEPEEDQLDQIELK